MKKEGDTLTCLYPTPPSLSYLTCPRLSPFLRMQMKSRLKVLIIRSKRINSAAARKRLRGSTRVSHLTMTNWSTPMMSDPRILKLRLYLKRGRSRRKEGSRGNRMAMLMTRLMRKIFSHRSSKRKRDALTISTNSTRKY